MKKSATAVVIAYRAVLRGAIRIINGKARLMAENLCDGLGACLGHCPMGAITVEERSAEDFDHHAVEKHLKAPPAAKPVVPAPVFVPAPVAHASGCPGSRMRMFEPVRPQSSDPKPESSDRKGSSPSRLRQWPVQLTLLPTQGPIWADADVLLAADCVPFAYPDFHENLLAGRTLAIACPKLDNCQPYIEKLATIFCEQLDSVDHGCADGSALLLGVDPGRADGTGGFGADGSGRSGKSCCRFGAEGANAKLQWQSAPVDK